jgi:hypothetical protein
VVEKEDDRIMSKNQKGVKGKSDSNQTKQAISRPFVLGYQIGV